VSVFAFTTIHMLSVSSDSHYLIVFNIMICLHKKQCDKSDQIYKSSTGITTTTVFSMKRTIEWK
jgi:hypothetical protein